MPVLIPKHARLRPDGEVSVTGGDGPEYTVDTVMCVHCNRHGVYTPGYGKTLGKCLKCMGILCPDCAMVDECLPIEKRLDLYASGKLDRL